MKNINIDGLATLIGIIILFALAFQEVITVGEYFIGGFLLVIYGKLNDIYHEIPTAR